MLLISLMQKAIEMLKQYYLPCMYFMYIHQIWQHQINIKMYGQIEVSVQHQFDANS